MTTTIEPISVPTPIATPKPIVAWLGLDWADRKHFLVLQPLDGGKIERSELEHSPQALEEYLVAWHQKHPEGTLGVCLEQSRGPVIYALMKYSFLVLYPVNPKCLADFRRAFSASGAKDDPRDADLLAELGAKHHQRLRPLQPQDAATCELALFCEHRRGFVDHHTGFCNELKAVLKCYYPAALEVLGEQMESPLGLAFLRRWPNLAALKNAKPSVLSAFFYGHNSRSKERIQQRLATIAAARPLTEDEALVSSFQLRMLHLLQQITPLQKAIAHYDQMIQRCFREHAESYLFNNLPGAAAALSPRLLVAFGTVRENFPDVQAMECYSGIAPVRKQSGRQAVVHFRYQRPKFLHQTFVEFAKLSVNFCPWARLLFADLRARGKGKFAAYRCIAFKWIRILWRCWTNRTAYNETTYLQALQKRGIKLYAPLYPNLSPSTDAKNIQ